MEKKEIGEAVNRGPCICHLLGSIVTPPFFPTMTLHFVTIIAIIREEHFSDATTMGRYLYTLVQPTHPCCVHTRIHVQQANFFVLRGSRAKSSSFRRISNFIVCFDTRFRVATETTLLPCWRLREPILSERVFPPPCENIGYSNFFHTLVSYYSSVSWQSYLIGLNIELLEHVGME